MRLDMCFKSSTTCLSSSGLILVCLCIDLPEGTEMFDDMDEVTEDLFDNRPC